MCYIHQNQKKSKPKCFMYLMVLSSDHQPVKDFVLIVCHRQSVFMLLFPFWCRGVGGGGGGGKEAWDAVSN